MNQFDFGEAVLAASKKSWQELPLLSDMIGAGQFVTGGEFDREFKAAMAAITYPFAD